MRDERQILVQLEDLSMYISALKSAIENHKEIIKSTLTAETDIPITLNDQGVPF